MEVATAAALETFGGPRADLQMPPLWDGVVRLARVADRGTVLDTILTMMETLGLVGPHILLSDRRSGILELAAHRGIPWQLASKMGDSSDPVLAPFIATATEATVSQESLGRPVSVPLGDGLFHHAAALYGDNRLVAVLGWLGGNSRVEELPAGLEPLASVFAAALLRVLRGARQRKRTSQRDAVRRAALVVGEATDLESMLRAICDRTRLLTGAARVAVRPMGPSGWEGEWVVNTKIDRGSSERPETWPHVVPIRHQGRQLAEIRLLPGENDERPRDEDLQLTALLAEHVAALVEAARARRQLLREVAERRRTESWLSTVLEHSPVATLLLRRAKGGPTASGNRHAKELLGPQAEGSASNILPLLFSPEGEPFPTEGCPLSRALGGERIRMLEAQVCKQGEEPIPVMLHGEPIPQEDGECSGAVVVLENISAFKTLERMREQWTSLVTHDLRQPITSILGFSGLLAERAQLPDDVRNKVQHIRSAARRLARISSDLLDASRMDANQLTLEKKRVDICSLARGIVDEMSREGSGQPIHVLGDEEVPVAEIDPIRLEQVLENLLSNARKYGKPGTPILLRVEKGTGEVLIHVENEGDGLDPEDVGRIFTRFYRGRSATEMPGMGLGLYISKGLIEAHKGRIWATSIKGRSVTFSVALPTG